MARILLPMIVMSTIATATAWWWTPSTECTLQENTARCDEVTYLPRDEPLQILGKPRLLYLTRIEGEIPAGAFRHFPYVEELEMYPGITYIEPGAFEDLKSVRFINLFNNSIRYIVRGTFRGCTTLTQLTLKQNRINYIEPHAFEELTNLRLLDLSGNPELKVLRDHMFSGLKSLTLLQCVLCGIYSIESLAFYDTPHLKELNLQSNFIGDLNGTNFEHLRELRKLDLTANSIRHINVEGLLRSLIDLREIKLTHNEILCSNIKDIETRFQRRNVIVHVRIIDYKNNQILSCKEAY